MIKKILNSLIISTFCFSCNNTEIIETPLEPTIVFKNYSNALPLVKKFDEFKNLEIYTLMSSSDTIKNSPNFIYAGACDGQGFLKNTDGSGYTMVTNHEGYWSISRILFDNTLQPIKGEYILNADGSKMKLCSATLAKKDIHGFGPLFLSASENGPNSEVQAIDPLAIAEPSKTGRTKPALGKFSCENAVPLPMQTYPNKTVILLAEDDTNGQVYLYLADTYGDLDNGKLYVLRRTDGNSVETNMKWNTTYTVEFVEVPNAKTLTGTQTEALNTELKSIVFGRVEDLDYRKGTVKYGREIYFAVTGISNTPSKTNFGRVYQLVLNDDNPLKGNLKIIADGDTDPNGNSVKGTDIINPDNICVTQNYVYIQEDGDSGFKESTHDSYIWQYNIDTKTKKPFINMRNNDPLMYGTVYNPNSTPNKGIWEYGAMTDISEETGIEGTFLLNIHAHTWVEGNRYLNAPKSTTILPYKAGGQTLILKNVPK